MGVRAEQACERGKDRLITLPCLALTAKMVGSFCSLLGDAGRLPGMELELAS